MVWTYEISAQSYGSENEPCLVPKNCMNMRLNCTAWQINIEKNCIRPCYCKSNLTALGFLSNHVLFQACWSTKVTCNVIGLVRDFHSMNDIHNHRYSQWIALNYFKFSLVDSLNLALKSNITHTNHTQNSFTCMETSIMLKNYSSWELQ